MWQAPFLEFYYVRIGQDFPQDIFFQDVLLEFLQFGVENPDHHIWSLCGVLSLVDGFLGFLPLAGRCEGRKDVRLAKFSHDSHAVLK